MILPFIILLLFVLLIYIKRSPFWKKSRVEKVVKSNVGKVNRESKKDFISLWFYLPIEIKDIAKSLKEHFGYGNFLYDYEDTWEWCEFNEPQRVVNISRKHNWERGEYEEFVWLTVRFLSGGRNQVTIDCFAQELSTLFDIDVIRGVVEALPQNNYNYIAQQQYSPQNNSK